MPALLLGFPGSANRVWPFGAQFAQPVGRWPVRKSSNVGWCRAVVLVVQLLGEIVLFVGLVGCLFGWLFVWLVDCLVGWLFDWLVVWLVGCLVGWLVGWLAGWLVGFVWLLGWVWCVSKNVFVMPRTVRAYTRISLFFPGAPSLKTSNTQSTGRFRFWFPCKIAKQGCPPKKIFSRSRKRGGLVLQNALGVGK